MSLTLVPVVRGLGDADRQAGQQVAVVAGTARLVLGALLGGGREVAAVDGRLGGADAHVEPRAVQVAGQLGRLGALAGCVGVGLLLAEGEAPGAGAQGRELRCGQPGGQVAGLDHRQLAGRRRVGSSVRLLELRLLGHVDRAPVREVGEPREGALADGDRLHLGRGENVLDGLGQRAHHHAQHQHRGQPGDQRAPPQRGTRDPGQAEDEARPRLQLRLQVAVGRLGIDGGRGHGQGAGQPPGVAGDLGETLLAARAARVVAAGRLGDGQGFVIHATEGSVRQVCQLPTPS